MTLAAYYNRQVAFATKFADLVCGQNSIGNDKVWQHAYKFGLNFYRNAVQQPAPVYI